MLNNISYLESSFNESGILNQNNTQSYDKTSLYSEISTIDDSESITLQIYNDFKMITKDSWKNSEYLLMVLAFEKNLRKSFKLMCEKPKYANLNRNKISHLRVSIQEEIKTWDLIYKLYDDRFNNLDNNISNGSNKSVHTEVEAISRLFSTNKEVRECQIVVEWLESFMQSKMENNRDFLIGSHGKSWEHTKSMIRKNRDYMPIVKKKCCELDPDAPLRGALNLTDSDKADELEYFKYLFNLLRAGELDKAFELCQSHDELWRILTLEGYRCFINPFLRNSTENNDEISPNKLIKSQDVDGNSNRALFLDVCRNISDDTSLNLYERAIYALFAGNLSVLTSLDKDWTNNLWAHFKVFVNEKLHSYLDDNVDNGVFNTQSIFGRDDFDWSQLSSGLELTNFVKKSYFENYSLEQLFDATCLKLMYDFENIIESGNHTDSMAKSNFYKAVFQFVQKCLISGDIEELTLKLNLIISRIPDDDKVDTDMHMLRFLSHLVIFLYSTHFDLNSDIYHSVLEAYIKCLIELKNLDNVTFYISKLPTDLQIKWFSLCLKDVIDESERKRCIRDAGEYELPIVKITNIVARDIRINGYDSNVARKSFRRKSTSMKLVRNMDIDQESSAIVDVSDFDQMRIDGLSWLTFLTTQQCYLVRQINALCRDFIEDDKYEAAKLAMAYISEVAWNTLSTNKTNPNQPAWLSSVLYENNCIRKYLFCMDLYSDWYDNYNRKRPNTNITVPNEVNALSFEEKQKLQKQYEDNQKALNDWQTLGEFYATKFMDNMFEMLKMGNCGWLSELGDNEMWKVASDNDIDDIVDKDNDIISIRRRQCDSVRRHCIMKSVFMLIECLIKSNKCSDCFSLINLLVNDDYQLYEILTRKNMEKILLQIRQCSIKTMESGKDCVGVDVPV